MRKLIYFLLLMGSLEAKSYMATIEPIHTYIFYAQATGEIVKLNEEDENKIINKTLLSIDKRLETARMKSYKKQLVLYKEEAKIRRSLFENSKNVRGKSQTQKDTLLLALMTQQTRILELKLKIEELQDTLDKKDITLHNLYVKELYVHRHDYVTVGTKVAKVFDVTKGKLVLYIHKGDVEGIHKRTILIDGKPSSARISKLDLSLDETYVSSYKAELIIDDISFGKLVTVEFKEEKLD